MNRKDDKLIKISDQLLPLLTDAELEQLSASAELEVLKRNMRLFGANMAAECPVDANHSIIKYGSNKKKQRYYCKDCNKSFTLGGKTMLSSSQVDLVTWQKIIQLILSSSASLRQISNLCKISENTAFYCKLRILYALEILNEAVSLSGIIEADEKHISYNLKGDDFQYVDRLPRPRGGQNTQKNWAKNSICVVVAVAQKQVGLREYNIASAVVGFGKATKMRIFKALKDKIAISPENVLITDGSKAYGMLAERLGMEWHRMVTKKVGKKKVPAVEGRYHIQTVNAFHSKMEYFIRNARGFSAKYLKGHLQLFDFKTNYAHLTVKEQGALVIKTLLSCPYHLTNDELCQRYQTPHYIDQYKEDWKSHFSRKELRLYNEIKNGVKKKDLIEKYGYSYKRMRTLVRRIEELQIEQQVLEMFHKPEPKSKISERSWEIYTLYQGGNFTQKELGQMFDCTPQNIAKIVARINGLPEAMPRKKKLGKAEIKKRRRPPKVSTEEVHQKIYDDFNVLCAGNNNITLTKAYELLAMHHGRSITNIRNIVFAKRKADPNAVWRKKGLRIAIDVKHHN